MKERIYSTPADEGVDDAPDISEWGWAVNKPGFDEADALETLEDDNEFGEMDEDPEAALPPQEAYDAMTYMAPMDKEENRLIDEVPGLMNRGGGQLMFVDDADHEQWVRQMAKNGTHGIDRALEDAMYGSGNSEIGLKLRRPKFVKKIGRGIKSAGKVVSRNVAKTSKAVAKTSKVVAKKAIKLTKGFDPRRDAGKAKMVKALNAKLIRERANFLQAADLKKGIRKPRAGYEQTAKLWARNKIQGGGLPVSMKGESVVSGMIKGDVMGAWYNPASWFSAKTKYILENTEGERLAEMNQGQYDAYTAAKLAQGPAQPGEINPEDGTVVAPEEMIEEEEVDASEMEGEFMAKSNGSDTLGNFATEILGNKQIGRSESGAWLHKLNPVYWTKSSRERRFIDLEKKNWIDNADTSKRLKEQRRELEAGKRALQATSAARQIQSEAAAIDAQLKAVESNIEGDFVGGGSFIGAVRSANSKNHRIAKLIAKASAQNGGKLTPRQLAALRNVMKKHLNVRKARRAIVSGNPVEILGGESEYDFVVGATKSARPVGKKTWVEMTSLAVAKPEKLKLYLRSKGLKPNAQDLKHLANLVAITKKSVVQGDSEIGSLWSKAKKVGKVATMAAILPAAAGAYVTYKGGKWIGKKTGLIKKSSGSAASARNARIAAAQKRRIAALKKREVSLAKTAEAQAEAEAVAAAADAEAAAATAEAEAQAADAEAQEAEFTPDDGGEGDETEMEGEIMKTSFVQGDFVGAWVGAVTDAKSKKIVAAAGTNTPIGKKIRAGATVVHKANKGDVKAKLAIAKIVSKSKAGDAQATRDLNALKAGKVALQAKGKAGKAIARKAQGDRIVAGRNKFEAAAGNKLAQMSRKRQLSKIANVERAAAKGNPKAKAAVAATVAKAAKGDPKAKTTVAALTLAKRVRVAAKTPREAKNLSIAAKTLSKARKGDRRAIQTLKVTQAAAKAGQPNAKRAMERLKTAQAVERAVATGKVLPPAKKLTSVEQKQATSKSFAAMKQKVASGRATREEALAGAKMAQKLGLREEAAALALRARSLKSGGDSIKKTAAVAAAAQAGNPQAQALVKDVLEQAQQGDPSAINSAGNLAAVRALSDVQSGRPMPREIAEATQLIERQRAGDPEATRIIERAGQAAQEGDSRGVEAAVALTAASAVLAATVAKPGAQREWRDKANESAGMKVPKGQEAKFTSEFYDLYAKVQKGEASRAEADRARQLAVALGKPKLAAEISALMPPATQGTFGNAVVSALQSPLSTYSEGVKSRSS